MTKTMRSKVEAEHVLTGKCETCGCDLLEKHGPIGVFLRHCIDHSKDKPIRKLTLSGMPKTAKGWA